MIEVTKEPIIENTTKFKNIIMEFIYPYKKEEKWTVYSSLLIRVLLKKTKTYSSLESFSNALIKHYIKHLQMTKYNMGENACFSFYVSLPDNKILRDKEYTYQQSFSFLMEAIYEPLLTDEAFLESDVINAKKELKNYIKKCRKNITSYASIRLDEMIDDDGYFKDSLFYHEDEIDDIDGKKLYQFYKEVIGTKHPLVFVLGNVDEQLKSHLMNSFPKNLETNTFDTNYIKPFSKVKQLKEVNEKKDYKQSIVKFAYKIKDYRKEDSPVLSLVNSLMSSGSSNILFEYLRTKENLVYTTSSSISINHGGLFITAQISCDKKKKTIEIIKEVMNKMKDEEFLKDRLKNVKERKRINLERQKDSMSSILDDKIDVYLNYRLSMESEYKIIKNLTVKDIVAFVDRMELDTIYYLEGTNGKCNKA